MPVNFKPLGKVSLITALFKVLPLVLISTCQFTLFGFLAGDTVPDLAISLPPVGLTIMSTFWSPEVVGAIIVVWPGSVTLILAWL